MESVSYNDYIVSYNDSPGWNDQVLDAMDLVVADFPSHYGYVAFESSGSYYLIYGSKYSVSDGHIYFGEDCKASLYQVEGKLISLSGSDLGGFDFVLSPGTLVYTNLVAGYPDFKADNLNVPLFLGFCLVVTCLWTVLGRSSRR